MTIVISYRSKDREFATELCARLKSANLKPWMDTQIQGGTKWRDEFLNRIKKCQVFIPILSHSYLESEHCKLELFAAKSLGHLVIPVMLEDCWEELGKHEETHDLANLSTLRFYALRIVGLPITKDELFRRIIASAKQRPNNRTGTIYISYRKSDAKLATSIARILIKRRIDVWIATLHSSVGDNWRESQAKAMVNSSAHLVVLGKNMSQNNILRTEVMLSEAIDIPLYTVIDHHTINETEHSILNDQLRNMDLSYHRLYERHAFSFNSHTNELSKDLYKTLKTEQTRYRKSFGRKLY